MRYLRFAPAAAVVVYMLVSVGAGSAAAAVSVFPTPGSIASLPGTQITFRGVSPRHIGHVQVVGSSTGMHSGHVVPHSDNRGGSFLPDTPFAPGETVTVATGLDVLGATNGTFQFHVAVPVGPSRLKGVPMVSAGRHGVQLFRSRPDLQPAAIRFLKRSAPSRFGDIFITPQFGPVQNGPMLLDPSGNMIWFHPLPRNTFAADFRVQRLYGQPVLTWWQGNLTLAGHAGEGVIFDSHYNQIGTVQAGNGLQGTDLHEFLITNQGQAYILAISPLHWPGTRKMLIDSVIQEIDIKTGLVMFEWHALDHVPLSESFFKNPNAAAFEYDPYHLNSVALTGDGNMIISMRNTWADYKINHQTGAVMWTLGSNRSSFKLGRGAGTAFQHDLTIQPNGAFAIFDDGAGPPTVHHQSRAIEISINTRKKTAFIIKQFTHTPPLVANFEGSMQMLSSSEAFVGWGQQPWFSEFNAAGKLDFDANFVSPTSTYRAYRFRWNGSPQTQPVLATTPSSSGTVVYVSWNGAVNVASWRVLAGPSASQLAAVTASRKRGFETAISVRGRQACFQVQALSSSGAVLATSGVDCP
jgi:hypothetical protein